LAVSAYSYAMRDGLRRIVSAAPDVAIGTSYLITWISPDALGARSFDYLLLLMLFEFIVIHSSAFMGVAILGGLPSLPTIGAVAGLGLFYTLFVGAFAAIFHVWWPVTAFWMLTLNRLTPVLLGTRSREGASGFQAAGWATSVLLYLFGAFATTLLPMPRFGITPDVMAAHPLPGSGLWVDAPYRVLAFGTIYFLLQGLVELLWVGDDRSDVRPDVVA